MFAFAGCLLAQGPLPVLPRGPHKTPTAADAKVEPVLAGRPGAVLPRHSQRPTDATLAPTLPTALPGIAQDRDEAGTAWALGATWKASHDGTTFTFIPAFGSTARQNWPLALRLDEVRVGATAVPVTDGAVQVEGDAWRIARGGCIEHFALGRDAVEQSWVFAELPQRGELRLRLQATTELTGHDRGGDLEFTGPDGNVTYSSAVAIDAAGRRCALDLQLAGGGIELVVPAAFVAEATLPLVVDPIAAATALVSQTNFAGFTDLAFDYSSGEFLCVWQSAYSATDMDLWAQRLDGDSVPIGAPFTLDFTALTWAYPRVANNGQNDTFLVVAECSNGFAGTRWIGGRIWSLAGGAFVPFTIERDGVGGSLSGSCIQPDVGGDPAELAGTSFTVVWEREYTTSDHDIVMRQVDAFGALRTLYPTVVDGSLANESRPHIGKSNGYSLSTGLSGQYWPIVYQRTFAAGDEDVRGSSVAPDGSFVGASSFAIATSTRNELVPHASTPTEIIAGTRRHAVAFLRTEPGNSNDVCVAVLTPGGALLTTANLHTLEGAGAAAAWPQAQPTIDCDGVRFAVAYSELWNGTGSDFDVRASTVAFDPATNLLVAHESRAPVATSGDYEGYPALASMASGGGSTTFCSLALHRVASGTGNFTVAAAAYRAHSNGPVPTVRSTACDGLTIAIGDLPSLGRTLYFFQGDSGPLSGFVVGTPVSVPLPFCPGCTVGVDGIMVANPFGLAIPLQPSLVGIALAGQAWSAYSGTCLGAIALSDTIDFTVL
ncbi:MAG: hypothetical protein JNK15_14085 [Planctomycetes bacterium]|nr:hypothetical protein [Planctomycetota bacterium]